MVRHPSGALFVSGYWDPIPPVYKSVDQGTSWTRVNTGTEADGAAGNSDLDMAVGPDGTLYLLTLMFDRAKYAGAGIRVAVSRDVGATWTKWKIADTPAIPYYPYLVAQSRGELVASWLTGKGNGLRANLAQITVLADSQPPRVALAPSFAFESFMLPGFGSPTDHDAAGEYLPVIWLPDGSIGIVTPIQNVAAKRTGFMWRRYRLQR